MSTGFDQAPGAAEHPRVNVDEPLGQRPSIGELLTDISGDLTTLLRQEVELAKAEVRQSAIRAGKGAGMLSGALIAGHMLLLFVSLAVWWGLGDEMGRTWSALVVAGIWMVIGIALALLGRSELGGIKGLPKTAETVMRIPDAVRGHEEQS